MQTKTGYLYVLCLHFRVKERLMEILNEDREFIEEDDDRVRQLGNIEALID